MGLKLVAKSRNWYDPSADRKEEGGKSLVSDLAMLWISDHALTTLCVDNDEGVTKVFNSSLAGIVHAFVHSS